MSQTPKTLAIDYGTKRIGLAVSILSFAEPYGIVGNYEQTLPEIQKICESENIEYIVVGVSEREMAEESRKFGEEIKNKTGLPVEFIDETLTSKVVHQKILESGMKQSRRQQPIDHLAAAEMLQEWMDSQANPN